MVNFLTEEDLINELNLTSEIISILNDNDIIYIYDLEKACSNDFEAIFQIKGISLESFKLIKSEYFKTFHTELGAKKFNNNLKSESISPKINSSNNYQNIELTIALIKECILNAGYRIHWRQIYEYVSRFRRVSKINIKSLLDTSGQFEPIGEGAYNIKER